MIGNHTSDTDPKKVRYSVIPRCTDLTKGCNEFLLRKHVLLVPVGNRGMRNRNGGCLDVSADIFGNVYTGSFYGGTAVFGAGSGMFTLVTRKTNEPRGAGEQLDELQGG